MGEKERERRPKRKYGKGDETLQNCRREKSGCDMRGGDELVGGGTKQQTRVSLKGSRMRKCEREGRNVGSRMNKINADAGRKIGERRTWKRPNTQEIHTKSNTKKGTRTKGSGLVSEAEAAGDCNAWAQGGAGRTWRRGKTRGVGGYERATFNKGLQQELAS